jgi:hypothetical protein
MSNSNHYARIRANRVEDVEWLKKNQVTPHEIAGRLCRHATDDGIKTLSRCMYRANRPDLATWLEHALHATPRYTQDAWQ